MDARQSDIEAILARQQDNGADYWAGPDGKIRLGPRAPLYPCYTAEAARILCRFGSGPETESSNPGATLCALDVLRHFDRLRDGSPVADGAVDTLLDHRVHREPTGPCHWGIGTLFMQVEYAFLRYNLFYYVYVLSFYTRATGDDRFREALAELASKLDEEGRVVVERPHRGLKGLDFRAKGEPSIPATRRFAEITANVA